MKNLRTKLNNLPKVQKVIFRIAYPIIIYTILYLFFVKQLEVKSETIQLIFILLWAVLEWYLFLARRGGEDNK